jgi:hypothetical protein
LYQNFLIKGPAASTSERSCNVCRREEVRCEAVAQQEIVQVISTVGEAVGEIRQKIITSHTHLFVISNFVHEIALSEGK